MEQIGSSYSPDLSQLIVALCQKPTSMAGYPTITDISQIVNLRFVEHLERVNLYDETIPDSYTARYHDLLERELAKEIQNGRLLRLLVKLGFLNERPEDNQNPAWSETGDKYLIKLFRDFVFHQVCRIDHDSLIFQVYQQQTPVIDFAHVVESLNKVRDSLFFPNLGSWM